MALPGRPFRREPLP